MIQLILTGGITFIGIVLGWGFNIVRKNSEVIRELSQVIASVQQQNKDDNRFCDERHLKLDKKIEVIDNKINKVLCINCPLQNKNI